MKQRDEERERNITKRMKQYEGKYDFINKVPLESVVHITEIPKTDHPMAAAKIKSADKMKIRYDKIREDKKVLVWFQEHKDKFVDVTTLKTMLLQRYNPWRKTKRDQLQSWNILTFDPQRQMLMNTLI